MEFITVGDKHKVRIKDIEGIQEVFKGDVGGTVETELTMKSGKVITTFWPYETLLGILDMEEAEPIQVVKLEPEVEGAIKNVGGFAG